ncbi:Hypothetical protein CCH01_000410 [Clostridium chauvoei JF4335]|nr:Hypothetical protein CCH01_000410 [Clostridium chauvoei JF4335]
MFYICLTFSNLIKKESIALVMVAQGVIDAIRFCIFGLPF